jgi:hypothetical protein
VDNCPICGGPTKVVVEVDVQKEFTETGELDEGASSQSAYDECEDCGHKEAIQYDDDD